MIEELFKLKTEKTLRGTINPHSDELIVDNFPESNKLRLENGFSKRLAHTCRYSLLHKKIVQFTQIIWNDGSPFKELKARRVSILPASSQKVDFIIDPVEDVKVENLMPSLNSEILDSLADVILVTEAEPVGSPGPRVIYVNQAFERMTGFSKSELLGSTPRILQGPMTSPEKRAEIRRALQTWTPITCELFNYRKDGSTFITELKINPIQDETGWWTHWVAVQRDISERKAREEMKSAANRTAAVETLASGIAHDLNNRIAIASGQLALVSHKLKKVLPKENLNLCDEIAATNKRLIDAKSISSQFMDLTGKRNEKTWIEDPIEEIEKLVHLTVGTSGISIDIENHAEQLPAISIDFGLLSQVLSNLLLNSIQAIQCDDKLNLNPKIKVRFDYLHEGEDFRSQFFKIQVSDTGPGISEKVRDRLFSPYVTTKADGNGLGLFTSQSNMNRIGGYLTLIHTSQQGTTFEVGVPVSKSEKRTPAKNPSKSSALLDSSKPILLIDDQIMLITVMSEILKTDGFNTDFCHEYDSALQAIENGDYSLIICDLNLSSTFVTDKILEAAKHKNPEQVVAIMSGGQISTDPRISDFLKNYPDTILLSKPFDTQAITRLFRE